MVSLPLQIPLYCCMLQRWRCLLAVGPFFFSFKFFSFLLGLVLLIIYSPKKASSELLSFGKSDVKY